MCSISNSRMNKILVDHVRDPDEIANGGDYKPAKMEIAKAETVDHWDDSDDDQ